MDQQTNLYTFNEVLALTEGQSELLKAWNLYALHVASAGQLSIALYGDWIALYSSEEEAKANAINVLAQMTAWIKLYGPRYNSMQQIQPTSTATSKSRFNDTPETAGDYSSVEHTTNITIAENTTSSYQEKLDEASRDYTIQAVNDFRKRFLTWEE